VLRTDAGAEQLQAAAGTGRLDHRSGILGLLSELLHDRGRERIDGRRAHDADLIARLSRGVTTRQRVTAATAAAMTHFSMVS
jgi:hypothetical protein